MSLYALLIAGVLVLGGFSWWIVRLRADVRRLAEWHRSNETQKLDAHRVGRERKAAIKTLNQQIRTLEQRVAQQRAEHVRKQSEPNKEIDRLGIALRAGELELAKRQQAHGSAMKARMAAHARAVARMREDLHEAYKERLRALEWSLEAMLEPDRHKDCVKVRFHHEDQAELFARELEKAGGLPSETIRIYRCPICPRSPWTIEKYLHVTSDGQRGEIVFARPKAETLAGRLDTDTIAALRERVNGETA